MNCHFQTLFAVICLVVAADAFLTYNFHQPVNFMRKYSHPISQRSPLNLYDMETVHSAIPSAGNPFAYDGILL
ncbi:hypothetical protein AB6A40_006619 [Gnathostoma spinigerum]|uniref:Uncharacterized protein n=1 Tax=Gnathostoma spinigerum TaxID=75299 RepID=A0ABD6EIW0_9BILA